MALDGATLVVTSGLSGTASLIVSDLSYSSTFEPFDRLEFDNDKLRDARTATGERRIIIELLGGKAAQITTTCIDNTAVPLVPNSDSVFNLVARKFQILRITVTGAISNAADVNTLYTMNDAHQELLAQFQAHQKRAGGDTAYSDLITLQSDSLSYLTTTGVSAAGSSLESTISDVLITNIVVNNAFSIPNSLGGNTFYKTFTLTLEKRSIESLGIYSPL